MTKITVFMVAMLACCTISVSAQDAYQQAIEKYMTVAGNSDFDKDKVVESLTAAGAQAGKSEADCKAFVENDLYPQMVTIMNEAFKQANVTEEDLQTVTGAFETPEGKTAAADAEKVDSDENMQSVMMVLQRPMMAIMQGQAAQAIPVPDASASYKKKFHAYYTTCHVGNSLSQLVNAIKPMLGDAPEAETIISNLSMFLMVNGEYIMLTVAKDQLTEADLDFFNTTYSTPAGKKVIAASTAASTAIAPVAIQAMQKFMGGEHYPQQ